MNEIHNSDPLDVNDKRDLFAEGQRVTEMWILLVFVSRLLITFYNMNILCKTLPGYSPNKFPWPRSGIVGRSWGIDQHGRSIWCISLTCYLSKHLFLVTTWWHSIWNGDRVPNQPVMSIRGYYWLPVYFVIQSPLFPQTPLFRGTVALQRVRALSWAVLLS